MNVNVYLLNRSIIIALFCYIVSAGCASFPGKELPKYTYDQIKPSGPKVSVDYDAKFLSFGRENSYAVRIFQEEIEKVFGQSGVFTKVSAGIGSEKYHLSLVLENRGNLPLAFLSGFISGFTFLVIPAFARDEYILTVDVKQGEQVIKQYKYKHYMDTWMEIFLIFMTPTHFPTKVARDVIDDMLLNLLHDLEQDKILEIEPTTQ